MKLRILLYSVALAVPLCLAVTGCLNLEPAADLTRYFLLSSVDPAEKATEAMPTGTTLGIAPVTIPDYLKKPWVVVRTGDTEIRYSDYHKWGESLDKGIQRVLAENLTRQLGAGQVRVSAWRKAEVTTELRLTVRRFDVNTAGEAVLEAQWLINGDRSAAGHRVIRKSGPKPDADPAGAVATLSKALDELSSALAAELR